MALTGFWVSGVCHNSQQTAIDALAASFPVIDNGIIYHLISIGSSGSTGAAIAVYASPINSSLATTSVSRNIYFAACDPATSPVTLSQIFTVPPTPDVITAWSLGFIFPMVCYMAAWGYGAVLEMFKHGRG